jgi:8-oxo-dGTP diphosphatase
MVEYGERMEDAAKREVAEEIGIKIKIIKQLNAYDGLPSKDCKLHFVDVPYLGKIISGTPKPKDETSEVKWFKPQEIKKIKLAYNHKEILEKEGFLK